MCTALCTTLSQAVRGDESQNKTQNWNMGSAMILYYSKTNHVPHKAGICAVDENIWYNTLTKKSNRFALYSD